MDAMIRLENLSKQYPGQAEMAVDDVTMDIPDGDVVVLVGPSGSGKTTTMKMINRLIEPTSGRIIFEGEDVTGVDADLLRRRMGYVIQQVGLFRHKTIADNIATVPKLLGWDKQRIAERVDELLETVRMDPQIFRERYPKELSGGQRQRVGVARAMGADPPVLLMDEPFGAIDPITRDRLQTEFLRLQEEIEKTIVFVTHDIDEAVKMGDRIAIFNDEHRIAQYDDPATILTAPVDDFVRDFIGVGAAVKRLHLNKVGDIELSDWPTASAEPDPDPAELRRRLEGSAHSWLLTLDRAGRPTAWFGRDDVEAGTPQGQPVRDTVDAGSTLYEALDQMLGSRVFAAPVVGEDGAYRGVIDVDALSTAIHEMRGGRHLGGGDEVSEATR